MKNQKVGLPLLTWGGEFKSIDDQGILEGKAIVFGDEDTPDLSHMKDFFDKTTYVHPENKFVIALGYEHDGNVGPIGKATLVRTEDGWDARGELDMTNDFVKIEFENIKKGGWGFSTGAVGHMVARTGRKNDTHHIDRWLVGEVSITKTPAEPRALIHEVKSIQEFYGKDSKGQGDMLELTDVEDDQSEPYVDPSNLSNEVLLSIIKDLLKLLTEKSMNDIVVPQLNESLEVYISTLDEKLTGVVSDIKKIAEQTKVTPLQAFPAPSYGFITAGAYQAGGAEIADYETQGAKSSIEEEALLSEKMALLSDSTEKVDTSTEDLEKESQLETLEQSLNTLRNENEDLKTKLELLKTSTSTLLKEQYDI